MRNKADPIKVVSGHPPSWPEGHGFKAEVGPSHILELGRPLSRFPRILGNLRRWGSSGRTLRIETTGGLITPTSRGV